MQQLRRDHFRIRQPGKPAHGSVRPCPPNSLSGPKADGYKLYRRLRTSASPLDFHSRFSLTYLSMPFPIKTCVACGDEFELRPGKPGFANRCPSCSEPEETETGERGPFDPTDRRVEIEVNAARRRAIRDLLYRKDS